MTQVDPLTLAVIQAGLQQVCNEMDLAFSRSAFSPVIAEADDRSSGIYDRHTGALISQGELGLPVFVGTMQHSTAELIRLIGEGKAGAPEPGDIYIVNDPYLGGTHLMDVRFAMPFYCNGELFCWLQSTGHWPDIGGMVPGGFSAHATEVEQEGLRLPPVKLFKRGAMDAEIYAILCSNMRVADQRIGDIKAQAAALYVGERRLAGLIDRYGLETIVCGHRGDARQGGPADAQLHRRDPRRHLQVGGLRRLRRGGERAAPDRPRRHQGRRRAPLRFLGKLAALPGSDELGDRDDVFLCLPGDAPHLPRHPAQLRGLRAAQDQAPGGHLPRCALPAPRLRLRRRGLAADRGGGVPRPGAGHPRQGDGGAGRLVRQLRAGRLRSGEGHRLRHVPDLRRRLRRQRRPRRAHQRLLHHRHLQDPAGGGDGAVLPRPLPPLRPARGLRRRRARSAAASACTTRWSCCAATRAPPSSWTTAASARRVCWADRMARPTSCASTATAR